MKTNNLLIFTILSGSVLLGISACSDKSHTGYQTKNQPMQNEITLDQQAAAEDFVGHINYARIALAKHNGDRAIKHIYEVRNLISRTQVVNNDQRIVPHIESGRVVYDYQTDYQYHYFPIQAGPVEIKKLGHGPIWAKNDLAVTDAEIVYLTVNLSSNKIEPRLNEAEKDIRNNDFNAADTQLAKLTDEVVTVDEQSAVPIDVARDNIMLANNFVVSGNYNGARYALKHADKALSEMENDGNYASHHKEIVQMRHQVSALQNSISKKDPTLAQKTSAKLDKWWSELKDWSNN